jgi:uncharacterized protein
MKLLRTVILGLAVAGSSAAHAADDAVKVVYHLTAGIEEAAQAMRNIRNHLDADPTAKIVVVTNGAGIDFLLEGAEFAKGSKFAGPIGELANRGVEFRVCQNTLTARDISEDRLAMEASVVPSGVAEAARLQAREKFVYIRP